MTPPNLQLDQETINPFIPLRPSVFVGLLPILYDRLFVIQLPFLIVSGLIFFVFRKASIERRQVKRNTFPYFLGDRSMKTQRNADFKQYVQQIAQQADRRKHNIKQTSAARRYAKAIGGSILYLLIASLLLIGLLKLVGRV
jgi:hypothetical protein